MSFESSMHALKKLQVNAMQDLAASFVLMGWITDLWNLSLSFMDSLSRHIQHRIDNNEEVSDEHKEIVTFKRHLNALIKGLYLETVTVILNDQHRNAVKLLEELKTSMFSDDHKKRTAVYRLIERILVIEKEFGIDITEGQKLVIFRDILSTNGRIYTVALMDTNSGSRMFHNPQRYPVSETLEAVSCFVHRYCTEDPYYKLSPLSSEWEMEDLVNVCGFSMEKQIKSTLLHSL